MFLFFDDYNFLDSPFRLWVRLSFWFVLIALDVALFVALLWTFSYSFGTPYYPELSVAYIPVILVKRIMRIWR